MRFCAVIFESRTPREGRRNKKKAGKGDERIDRKRALQAYTVFESLRLGRKRNSQAHRVHHPINLTT